MSAAGILPWHRDVWSTVSQARQQQRLAHALLLTGPSGVGKRQFARALSQALLCEAMDGRDEACLSCRSCVQFAAGTHPNLFILQPLFDEKTEKQKRDISVEQLRDVGEKLVLSSHYGGAKVVIFDPADSLNVNGVNALLKTIEEPRPNTYLLLVSERPMALAATLRSRCQQIRFAPPESSEARHWLAQQEPGLTGETLSRALERAQGAPVRALAAHRSGQLEQESQWRRDWLEIAEQKRAPTQVAASIGKDRDLASSWLRAFIVFLDEILRARVGLAPGADLGTVPSRISMTGLQALIDEAYESARRITYTATPQLVAESLMIAWWKWSMARGGAAR